MLAVRLDPEMDKELEQLAAATGRSKSFYVKEALAAYLEDRADLLYPSYEFFPCCGVDPRSLGRPHIGTDRITPGMTETTRADQSASLQTHRIVVAIASRH